MKCGGKIFFGSLVICILSFFYFKLIPYSQVSNLIGYIFLEIFLGCNFYIGYKYKLNKKEAVMVGILGSSFGIFLLFFAAYTYYIMREFYWGIWMVKFYLFPTMSFINYFFVDITLAYVVFLIGFNIVLVILGSMFRFFKDKIVLLREKGNLSIYKDFL